MFPQRAGKSGEVHLKSKKIRATDAKEVGVENPAEETCCYPNQIYNSKLFLREELSIANLPRIGPYFLRLLSPLWSAFPLQRRHIVGYQIQHAAL